MQYTADITAWQPAVSTTIAEEMITALEAGKVVYFPQLSFDLEKDEQSLLSMELNPKGAKNISFNPKNQEIRGLANQEVLHSVHKMMQRYYQFSTQLLNTLCPRYQVSQHSGRTSFRPVEIKGRRAPSYRKDDTRLHVDAFPSTPTNNCRILRVFSNINPFDESRLWRLGEPYADVIRQFLPRVRRPWPLEAELLYLLRITRKKRFPYDHYMLQIHDTMKSDLEYQHRVAATEMSFPPGSTWMIYTDLVSHAALAGRFVLEQTYYPPITNMQNPMLSPQQQMQQLMQVRAS